MRVVKDGARVVHSKRLPIGADQVATYIKMGRQKVLDSAYDPYAKLKNPTQAMVKDAMAIACWFNAMRRHWTEKQRMSAYLMVSDIQFGPQLYWWTVLKSNLTPVHFKAAESWAERHKTGQWVDVRLHPEVRDCVFSLLDARLKLRKEKEPYQAMLDVLRFAFHGLQTNDSDNALEL